MKKLFMIKDAYGRGKRVGAVKAPKGAVFAEGGDQEVLVGPYYSSKEQAKLVRKHLNKVHKVEGEPDVEIFEHQVKNGPDHWRNNV